MIASTLLPDHVEELLKELGPGDALDSFHVQPDARAPAIHVLYGGAHLYRAGSAGKLGGIARAAMDVWGRDAAQFGRCLGITRGELAEEVARRVRDKLARAPVEAMCIDFEDGFGPRSEEEEDGESVRAAMELAKAPSDGPTTGIRIKGLTHATGRRAIRTLDIFVTTLVHAMAGDLPRAFTVTLPKVSRPREVAMLAEILRSLESALGLKSGRIGIEIMVETPRALIDEQGRVALPSIVAAAGGRCTAVHLGAYDLTASLGVAAREQRLDHPHCDFARALMQVVLAGTDIDILDGATTVLPIPRHRAQGTAALSASQERENDGDVRDAWTLHASNVRRALSMGIYRGWDLHPAQLPARYGAVYAFFLEQREAMAARLRAFIGNAAQARRDGRVFDDAATGQGLLETFARGITCGALDATDLSAVGLSTEELARRSFAEITAARATSRPS